ncbi:hypothetical protein SAMN05428975_4191 [Mucilaginibacter sp. OK268]|uniref:hypothetical protein n=1 Tax=Mucilaginibacter sp. OK268 TaxID=1881048 RepID=UPI00088E7D37|nr:hypothetical protein [Mucilaginibacter sp. OK268]SDP96245.1 hypothetical protein SAMN05428975_4191 [Mucilaginibacter sp. OK268]
MNWIIRRSDKLSAHTYLDELLIPILEDLSGFNWLLTDLDFNSSEINEHLPINFDHECFLLSENEFHVLLNANIQIWWGVILGFPRSITVTLDEDNLPFAEGNGLIWKNENIQHPDAQIEIICFDSGYTIIKFKDSYLSDKFKSHFTEAIALEKFKDNPITKQRR